jgi:hypothetical protein
MRYKLRKAWNWLFYSRGGDAVFGVFLLTMAVSTFLTEDAVGWLIASGLVGVMGALCLLNAAFNFVRVDWRTK